MKTDTATILRDYPEMKEALKSIILEKAAYLEELRRQEAQFLNSRQYATECGDFAPEFRRMVSDMVTFGKEIRQVERELKNMCFALDYQEERIHTNASWQMQYNHAQEVRIVEVIGRCIEVHTTRKPIRCPWHEDRIPSLKIYEADNHFHCFSCGAHGSPIDFIMQYKNCSFKEAVTLLSHF